MLRLKLRLAVADSLVSSLLGIYVFFSFNLLLLIFKIALLCLSGNKSIMGKPKLTWAVASDVTFGYDIIEIKKCFWDISIHGEVLHLLNKNK